MMPHRPAWTNLVAAAMLMAAGSASGHGGVSIEDDACVMQIGPYRAHFTGYQPSVRASQEFCEDIPVAAEAIIVLDFVNPPLREMAVEFRILKDINGVGVNATFADLGTAADIEAATVYREPPRSYPHGNLNIRLDFDGPGAFIGLVTAFDRTTNRDYTSMFPFSVGLLRWGGLVKWVLAALLAGAALYFLPFRSAKAET